MKKGNILLLADYHKEHMYKVSIFFQNRGISKFSFFVPTFKFVTPGAGQVWTPGSSYRVWLRSTRRCYIWNIKALRLPVSEIFFFKVFLLCSCVSNLWPPGLGQFGPQGHHLTILGRGQLADATYQISKVYFFLFQRRRILKFSFFVPCDPRSGTSFDPRGIIWTILLEVH